MTSSWVLVDVFARTFREGYFFASFLDVLRDPSHSEELSEKLIRVRWVLQGKFGTNKNLGWPHWF